MANQQELAEIVVSSAQEPTASGTAEVSSISPFPITYLNVQNQQPPTPLQLQQGGRILSLSYQQQQQLILNQPQTLILQPVASSTFPVQVVASSAGPTTSISHGVGPVATQKSKAPKRARPPAIATDSQVSSMVSSILNQTNGSFHMKSTSSKPQGCSC